MRCRRRLHKAPACKRLIWPFVDICCSSQCPTGAGMWLAQLSACTIVVTTQNLMPTHQHSIWNVQRSCCHTCTNISMHFFPRQNHGKNARRTVWCAECCGSMIVNTCCEPTGCSGICACILKTSNIKHSPCQPPKAGAFCEHTVQGDRILLPG